jgi:hypothetical protein
MTTATAATLFAASLAHGQVTAEVEPNQSKATATAVSAPMQPGDTLTGTTTVQAGSLRLAAGNALFGSPTVVRSGGLLEVASGVTARLPSLTLAGGTVSATMLAVNGTTGIGRLVIASGTVTGAPALTVGVGGVVELPASGRHVLSVGSLAVDEAAGGRIDVGTGRIEIAAGGIAQADLRADLLAARNGGAWNGPGGIGTSAAPGISSGRSVGYRVLGSGSGATIVAWAAFGDVNLDGQVNSTDISLITNAGLFGAGGTAAAAPDSRSTRIASSSWESRAITLSSESSKAGEVSRTTATSRRSRASGAWRISSSTEPRVSITCTMR